MGCYNMYIFNRHGVCLYYNEWHRPKHVQHGAGTVSDDQKMMFGLLFSLRTFTAALDPQGTSRSQLGAPLRIGEGCTFHSFKTNNYKLHFMETPSGIKIVLNTDADVGDLRDQLFNIYSGIFVEYVLKNPLYDHGEPFNFDHFTIQLNKYIGTLGL